MASVKIANLAIKTLSKPIAVSLKHQATRHESFRKVRSMSTGHLHQFCISIAQWMHRMENRLKNNLAIGSDTIKTRPLNDAKAIANGANLMSEAFLFFVAVSLIIGESYRSRRSASNKRDEIREEVNQLRQKVEAMSQGGNNDAVPLKLEDTLLRDYGLPTNGPHVGPPGIVEMLKRIYALEESTVLLWSLADDHGWLDNANASKSLEWALGVRHGSPRRIQTSTKEGDAEQKGEEGEEHAPDTESHSKLWRQSSLAEFCLHLAERRSPVLAPPIDTKQTTETSLVWTAPSAWLQQIFSRTIEHAQPLFQQMFMSPFS
ncbi:hypothetical protein MVES1_001994 [Malassezia vespertilionis]|uniref:Uncharacterized protein n=1 Tax=Malassezia vespertilionis TaxID=2020962 RepID=A0A2N1JBC2_9BASI|nr:uncharacterized protein MVES1_001994 [Malassezia vespertilionis]PKI83843.1 hypothetical protein MVES_001887 [Malassezia vespertilionis]WFD06640.1 hypothetical protein MVES1_001994 [Malassezia vespertilionis]